MRDITVDDEVYAEIQRRAVPLEDDANAVLRREFGLDGTSRARASASPRSPAPSRRARRGELLPSREYEMPLLETLAELGGAAMTADVLDVLEQKIGDRLTPLDRGQIESGGVRWRNRAQFVRLRLVKAGDMAQGSEYGVWEITSQGRARVRRGGSAGR